MRTGLLFVVSFSKTRQIRIKIKKFISIYLNEWHFLYHNKPLVPLESPLWHILTLIIVMENDL
jgi:uncharacterized membrane protein